MLYRIIKSKAPSVACSGPCKTITITDQQEDWVRAVIKSDDYGNDSEYFHALMASVGMLR